MNRDHYSQRGRTCSLLLATLLLALATPLRAQDVTINFRDADIRSVVESIAGITGKSFVLDPRVQGQVTIIAPQPIASELVYDAFLSALQVQGYQAVEDGAVTRIVPMANAFRMADGDAGNRMVTEVIQLGGTSAVDAVNLLRPVMSNGALVQPMEKGNYIVVTDTAAQVARMRDILARIDDPSGSEVEVIALQHISAGEALQIASQLTHLQNQRLSIVEDSFNNRIIVAGSAAGREALRGLIAQIDVPHNRSGAIEVLYLNYAEAEQVKPLLDSMLASPLFATTGADGAAQKHTIEADLANNALVVAAPATVSGQIRELVRQLDRPRQQVLIEAIVAEVSEDQAQRISSQLAYASRDGGVLINFDNLVPALLGLAVEDGDPSAEDLAGITFPTGALAGGVTWDEGDQRGFGLLIEALKSDANTNILSTPSLVTLNNEEASITVGQEVPFITGSYTNTNESASNPFQTIERREVGIKLRVRPHINEDNAVRLEIEQESSNLLATSAQLGTADVVTAKRVITTNVMVENGEFLVLGGLIDESSSNDSSRVPFLGRIPLLGNLFKSKAGSGAQRVLMMFIRPTVLDSRAANEAATMQKYDYIRQRQLQFEDSHGGDITLLPADPGALLDRSN